MKSIIILLASIGLAQAADFTYDPLVKKIAFGSGHNQKGDDSHWKAVIQEFPNLWLWLGELTQTQMAGPNKKRKAYDEVLESLGYQELRARSQVLGTWDGEDAQPNRWKNKQPLLEFLNEPYESLRFKRYGMYGSYLLGPEGKRIKLIVLDTFMHRNEKGKDRQLLGKDQWGWLEKELTLDTYQILLVASPLPVLGKAAKNEAWRDYPAEYQKLLNALDAHKTPAYVLSGHIHYGEVSSVELPSQKSLVEVTSSGLNDVAKKTYENQFRVGEAVLERNFGVLEFQWPAKDNELTEPKVFYQLHQL